MKLQSHLVILFHIFTFTSWLVEGADFLTGFRCEKSFIFFEVASGWRSGLGKGVNTGVHLCFFVYEKVYSNVFVASCYLLELCNSGAVLYTPDLKV